MTFHIRFIMINGSNKMKSSSVTAPSPSRHFGHYFGIFTGFVSLFNMVSVFLGSGWTSPPPPFGLIQSQLWPFLKGFPMSSSCRLQEEVGNGFLTAVSTIIKRGPRRNVSTTLGCDIFWFKVGECHIYVLLLLPGEVGIRILTAVSTIIRGSLRKPNCQQKRQIF